jgi:hypothetical protein
LLPTAASNYERTRAAEDWDEGEPKRKRWRPIKLALAYMTLAAHGLLRLEAAFLKTLV